MGYSYPEMLHFHKYWWTRRWCSLKTSGPELQMELIENCHTYICLNAMKRAIYMPYDAIWQVRTCSIKVKQFGFGQFGRDNFSQMCNIVCKSNAAHRKLLVFKFRNVLWMSQQLCYYHIIKWANNCRGNSCNHRFTCILHIYYPMSLNP